MVAVQGYLASIGYVATIRRQVTATGMVKGPPTPKPVLEERRAGC